MHPWLDCRGMRQTACLVWLMESKHMDFDPIQFGARADGITDDAPAIQAAIQACADAGGGRVILKSGKTFRSASLHLKSFVELHLEAGSRLLASDRLEEYFRPDQPGNDGDASNVGTPVTGKPSYVFLYAFGAEHAQITGAGVIDGCGTAFVRRVSPWYVTGDFYPRPTLIYVENCRHLTFRDTVMCNVSFWTLHMAGCEDVLVDAIRILNPLDVANSDGIDVDHSRYVRIRDCHITCADDCVCMKNTLGNTEYPNTRGVIVSGCTLISTSAALKIGTEGVDDFEDILFTNCVIDASNRGLSVQVRDKGNVRHVVFDQILIRTRRFADSWWGCAEPIAVTAVDRSHAVPGGSIEDVRFSHINCEGENGILLYGEKGRIRNILMEDVNVRLVNTSRWPKDRYDLRPGEGMTVVEHPSVPMLCHGVEELEMRHVSLKDVQGKNCEPAFF